MKRKVIYLTFIALAGLLITYSCSSKKTKVDPTPVTPAATVSIKDFAFVPSSVTVKAGSSVTWTNKDSAPHTVTELTSAFDSGSISTGNTFNYTFNTKGTFTYHCLIHSMMASATVVVN